MHMERHRRTHFPQVLRYPFFLIGLVILIGGGVGALKASLPHSTALTLDATVGIVGFIFLALAIVFP